MLVGDYVLSGTCGAILDEGCQDEEAEAADHVLETLLFLTLTRLLYHSPLYIDHTTPNVENGSMPAH